MPVIDIFEDAVLDIKKGDTCSECGEPCMVDGRCYKCESHELEHKQDKIIYSYLRRRY